MKKIFSQLLLCFLLLAFALPVGGFAASGSNVPLEAYGLDTIAGVDTYLRTSKTSVNSDVYFSVVSPDGEVSILSAYSGDLGVAQLKLDDFYTRVSGDYSVAASLSKDFSSSKYNSFEVYSGEVSLSDSTLLPGEQVVRSAADDAFLTVKLTDAYDNPIDGHLIKLVSSVNSGSVDLVSSSSLTDENGEVVFEVSSDEVGTVTYSAYDVTADVVLDSKAKVAYFDSADYVFTNSIPDKYKFAAVGNSSSSVDSLKFDNFPSSVFVGDSVTFALDAIDFQEEVVTNYLGTVRFSVVEGEGSFVNLPDDYEFVEADLGSHTFSLALSFLAEGKYLLQARDVEENAVFGEYEVVVAKKGGSSSGSGLMISNPSPGTYSNNVQVLSGKAPASASLKIFDNDVEIGSVIADPSGSFSFTTAQLVEGAHSLSLALVNEVGVITATSGSIDIIIDTSGPEYSQIVLDPPSPVDPGTIVTVKLYTNDDLSQAAILFRDNIFDLAKNPGGYYEGSFAAPIEFGEYSVDFVLVDQLGNEQKIENEAKVNVGGIVAPPDGPLLGNVSGLSADPDDHRVTLTWNPPSSVVNAVNNYRVFYGLSPNQLTEAVDTFTPSTTWYVPNLKNGVEYYFAVVAVDDKGNISETFSNIVSSVPNPDVVVMPPPGVLNGSEGGEALGEMERDASESGPEMVWLLIFSLLGGFFYNYFSKKRAL